MNVPYQKLSVVEKRAVDSSRVREPAVACPRCSMKLEPADLIDHMAKRCPGALPEPHALSRWLSHVTALRLAPSSRLEDWRLRGLLRRHGDGRWLERDLVQLVAWSRTLGCL